MNFEICNERQKILSIEVRDHEIASLDNAVDAGSAVRVIKNKRLGCAYSTDSGDSEASLIAMAEAASVGTEEDHDFAFPMPKELPAFRRDIRPLLEMGVDAKVGLTKDLEKAILSFDKRIKAARRVIYDESIRDVSIKNSNGVDHRYSTGLCAIHATAIAEDGGEVERATEVEYSFDPGKLDIEEIAARAAGHALFNLNARKISSCKCPCILNNMVVAEMLSIIAQAFFADQVFKHKSPLVDKLGKELYSKAVGLVDDGLSDTGISAVPFDAEGSPSRTNVLVEGGLLKGFLSDVLYAKKMSIPCTASSVRQHITQMPRIGTHNFQILPGGPTLEALKKEMGKGFYVKDVMGLHTANPVTGDFSVGAAGAWVEDGTEVYGVKGVTIAGNFHDMLKKVAKCASDLKFMMTCAAPSILIEEMAISGS